MKIADRRVKIVATVGPASNSQEMIQKLIEAGVNVFRLNFSHGSHEEHFQAIKYIRSASQELSTPVAILQDLQGPKIRVGKLVGGKMLLESGSTVVLTTRKVSGENNVIPTDFEELPASCRPGQKILLDDGLLELKVLSVKQSDVECRVVYGGELKDRKGINIPGANLKVECLTEKDLVDLYFGLKHGVDYIALSFVRKGEDIRQLRTLIDEAGGFANIVAKIEMYEALENLNDIVQLSDAVMVARGDLAVEVGQSLLPGYQKEIIELSNTIGKPVITATQMLDSMVNNPRPTRAEVTDIANAVLDGSDALMLSAESASGKYPIKCVETMGEIIGEVERTGKYYYRVNYEHEFFSIAEAIAAGSCLSALKLNASAIVCLTTTGKTARLISSFRPKCQILAVTHLLPTLNRLELVWGIQTLQIDPYNSSDEAMERIEGMLLQFRLVKPGDRVILTMGLPILEQGTTNSLRVYTVRKLRLAELSNSELPVRFRRLAVDTDAEGVSS
ncbi:MAG: pyruvate kinase [Bdellovibrionales bacterium CG10_big_fil_rev_8_21_14_0_10_45_34]|nr:MAG: pyruvate kinase [Bdellovibrionales bacterium CG10_big_fil_rev_8_21_14_0_10_45_34]